VILLVLFVLLTLKDGAMNLFEKAELLAGAKKVAPVRRKTFPVPKKAKNGVITRRDGLVITDTVKRVGYSFPVVKEKVERMGKADLGAECIDDWLNPYSRRKALGKSVYERREELIRILRDGYSVNIIDIQLLSLNSLLIQLDAVKAEQARSLEFKKKVADEAEERLGNFYKSFVIVSDIESIYNTEHYKLAGSEKSEDERFAAIPLSKEERAKRQAENEARWMARKAILDAKLAEKRFEEIACSGCFTLAEIYKIMDGEAVSYVSLDEQVAARKAAERKLAVEGRGPRRDVNNFVEKTKNGFLEGLI